MVFLVPCSPPRHQESNRPHRGWAHMPLCRQTLRSRSGVSRSPETTIHCLAPGKRVFGTEQALDTWRTSKEGHQHWNWQLKFEKQRLARCRYCNFFQSLKSGQLVGEIPNDVSMYFHLMNPNWWINVTICNPSNRWLQLSLKSVVMVVQYVLILQSDTCSGSISP